MKTKKNNGNVKVFHTNHICHYVLFNFHSGQQLVFCQIDFIRCCWRYENNTAFPCLQHVCNNELCRKLIRLCSVNCMKYELLKAIHLVTILPCVCTYSGYHAIWQSTDFHPFLIWTTRQTHSAPTNWPTEPTFLAQVVGKLLVLHVPIAFCALATIFRIYWLEKEKCSIANCWMVFEWKRKTNLTILSEGI